MARFVLNLPAQGPTPTAEAPNEAELYAGLRALADSAFPKSCRNCGRKFETADEFVRLTERVGSGTSGLKQSCDDDGSKILEVFRNCPCGSTLMDCFSDRRDSSPAGLARREKFGQILDMFVSRGLDRTLARVELLKILRGEPSALIKPAAN